MKNILSETTCYMTDSWKPKLLFGRRKLFGIDVNALFIKTQNSINYLSTKESYLDLYF
jgi:hypothetical protein